MNPIRKTNASRNKGVFSCRRWFFLSSSVFLLGASLMAEGPQISAIFPTGGAPGTTVEVKILGAVGSVQDIYTVGKGITAEFENPPETDHYVKKWHIIGPFSNAEDKGFDAVYPPEKDPFNPKQTFVVGDKKAKKQLKWKAYPSPRSSRIALDTIYRGNEMVAYARGVLVTDRDKPNATFVVAADDGIKVWVNGKLTLSSHEHLPLNSHRRSFRANLKKGKNEILVKVDQGIGEWEFELRQTDTLQHPGMAIHSRKCSECHDLRSPANRLLTGDQWEATVWRMIREKEAPIEENEAKQIIGYLRVASKRRGLTANIKIDKDAAPGPREIRLATSAGVSTAWSFYVGHQVETVEAEPNGEESPQPISLPATVNGMIGSSADRDAFLFEAKKGDRMVFNVKAFRINERSQIFFMPRLNLYDSERNELARNNGYYFFDPLIDYTFENDGKYTLVIKDLLYRGTPACVYRIEMGKIPYNTYIYPAGGRTGQTINAVIGGDNTPHERSHKVAIPADWPPGYHKLGTPFGIFDFLVSDHADFTEKAAPSDESIQAITLPSSVNGRITEEGQVDRYRFTVTEASAVSDWWVIQPFPNNAERGLDDVFPPEKEIDFEKEYVGKGGRKLRWYKSNSRGGKDIFTNAPEDATIGYALTYLDSPADRDAILQVGSDDGVKVWVNDEVVWINHIHRPLRAAEDVVAVRLKKGRNKILVKVENGYGEWGMTCAIDGYTFEANARSLGSALSGYISLHDTSGRLLANASAQAGDARLQYSFAKPGEYEIRVSDLAGNSGSGNFYRLVATRLSPDFNLTVSPDNPNIGRGSTLPLIVEVTNRIGFSVPIELEVKNLPSGVTASATAISIDQDRGLITLTAAKDAPLESSQVQVVGHVRFGGRMITRKAEPFEIYRIINQPTPIFRDGMAVSVMRSAPFALEILNTPEELIFTRKNPTVDLRIKVTRSPGFRRQLVLRLGGLPAGISAPPITLVKPGANSATMRLRADTSNIQAGARGNLFVARTPGTGVYQIAVLGQLGRDSNLSSPAVTVKVLDAKEAKQVKAAAKLSLK